MAGAWYVLRSKPHKEQALSDLALGWAMDVFYPRIRVEPVNPRSRKIRPYFPGYLFAKADLETAGSSFLRHIPMSMGVVEFGGQPAVVGEEIINQLRRHLGLLNARPASPTDRFKPGDKVIITSGAFEGYEALFDASLPGSMRVRVLLAMLNGRQIRAAISASSLEPSPHSSSLTS
jgi:transcription antitermination factor NusG